MAQKNPQRIPIKQPTCYSNFKSNLQVGMKKQEAKHMTLQDSYPFQALKL